MQSKAPTATQSKADDPKVLASLVQHTAVLHLSCLCHSADRDADALALLDINLDSAFPAAARRPFTFCSAVSIALVCIGRFWL